MSNGIVEADLSCLPLTKCDMYAFCTSISCRIVPFFFTGKGVEIGSNVAVASKDATGSVLSKTAEVGSNLVGSIPLPAKLKGKDKKE